MTELIVRNEYEGLLRQREDLIVRFVCDRAALQKLERQLHELDKRIKQIQDH